MASTSLGAHLSRPGSLPAALLPSWPPCRPVSLPSVPVMYDSSSCGVNPKSESFLWLHSQTQSLEPGTDTQCFGSFWCWLGCVVLPLPLVQFRVCVVRLVRSSCVCGNPSLSGEDNRNLHCSGGAHIGKTEPPPFASRVRNFIFLHLNW